MDDDVVELILEPGHIAVADDRLRHQVSELAALLKDNDAGTVRWQEDERVGATPGAGTKTGGDAELAITLAASALAAAAAVIKAWLERDAKRTIKIRKIVTKRDGTTSETSIETTGSRPDDVSILMKK